MAEEKKKNQIIVIEPVTKTVNELLEAILEKDQAEVSPFQNSDEAVQFARQVVPCMLVICIQSNNDIPAVLNTLKKLKPDIKQGLVKTLLVSKVKNPQLQKLIGEFGVTDYIEEPIPARTLQFKANLQLKAVDTTRRRLELQKQSEEKIVFKTSKKEEEETHTAGADVKTRSKPALQLANDTFLIKNGSVKKQGKKYTVELDGPDPSTGEWVSEESPDPENPNWRWQPHDKEDEPGSEEGDGWVCSGEKPQFKLASKKWQLSAEKPSLFFKKKKLKVAEKITTDADGEVVVADDSEAAEENLRKNLKKALRQKKKRQAEAAGLPFLDEEEETPPPAAKAPEEEEDDSDTSDPIVKAQRKAKRAKASADAAGAEGGLTEESEGEETTEETAKPESEARKKLEKLRKARKQKKEAALAAGIPEEEAAEDAFEEAMAEAAVEEEDSVERVKIKKRPKGKKEKGDGQLLDFLKKKKEGTAKAQANGENPEGDSAAGSAGGEEEEHGDVRGGLKKKRRTKKVKSVGANGEEIVTEEEEAEDEEEISAAEIPEKETAAIGLPSEAETVTEESDILVKARARKKSRQDRKKALLEEIQAEVEPEAADLEAEERARKAKETGEEIEEAPEEGAGRNDRLEKLRRKREELAKLEREEEAEENGVALHTTMAEELRGLNVWDTDEEPAGDEGPTEKLLKKLKKDRKEKADAEKKSAGDPEDAFDREESSIDSGPVKKKKRKDGAPTQADGLEDIFSDQDEHGESPESRKNAEDGDSDTESDAAESKNDRLDRLRKKRDQDKAAAEKLSGIGEETAGAAEEKKEREESEDFSAGKKSGKDAKDAFESDVESGALSATRKNSDDGSGEDLLAAKEAEIPKKESKFDALDAAAEKQKTAALSATEKLKKKSESSESMKRFLERRKQRKENGALDLSAEAKKSGEDLSADPAGQKRSFLGIFVAISDSFGLASDKKMINIFRAFEISLEGCVVALVSPTAGNAPLKVLFAASLDRGFQIPAENCRIETFTNDEEKTVAHLALQMVAPRTNFAEDENDAITRAVRALRPLVLQWLTNNDGNEKVAA